MDLSLSLLVPITLSYEDWQAHGVFSDDSDKIVELIAAYPEA